MDIRNLNEMAVTDKIVDFTNTRIAFSNKSDKELKKMAWLFKMMNNSWLVNIGSKLGLLAVKLRLPFSETVIRKTIFEQFVGGTTLLECVPNIKRLEKSGSLSILDYGAEAKKTEQDFNKTMNENIRAIEFAHQHDSVPVISTKITGLARFGLLESIQKGESLTRQTRREYRSVLKRIDSICHFASERKVAVFFDAEESWIQQSIDHLVNLMMRRYNQTRVVVYNTFQMYRHDRLQFLFDSFDEARRNNYMLGAKLVRGAYMEK
ncbi:MAG: proline dehydrogenase family protein, partial [Bacteroidota bacterium]